MKMTLSEFMDHLSTVEAVDTECGFDMAIPGIARHQTKPPACCIGGHAALLLGNADIYPSEALITLTDIPFDDARAICFPGYAPAYTATLQQALAMLEHYSSTGEVDWPRALEVPA